MRRQYTPDKLIGQCITSQQSGLEFWESGGEITKYMTWLAKGRSERGRTGSIDHPIAPKDLPAAPRNCARANVEMFADSSGVDE